ncbi:cupin [Gluconacetobacter azotocaptans]|uniref:Cupin n=2 Tax=Gluconacetobacter azotocaptans TaxID=142834 RepID=A0A7W4JVG3_9PROT|nr:cupin [Gluconacetobacter azotocaptans]MBM9400047.1 cupin [Gluconacetobacter azotocaptans]
MARVIRSGDYIGGKAWDALEIETFEDVTVRLHWTDRPYVWHVNDGPEVFAVLDGVVEMHVRHSGGQRMFRLEPGDIFHVHEGDEHRAMPQGAARILVIERKGSV